MLESPPSAKRPSQDMLREEMHLNDELELEVRLISGKLLAKVHCFRSEGFVKLRERVKEACQIKGPFWLLQNQRLLRSPSLGQPDPVQTLEANASLVLVKRSVSDLSQELVGFEGAAFRGDAQEVFRLLDDGAEIDYRDTTRLRTPLMWAATGGHSSLCLRLLKRGANPMLRASGANAAQLAQGNGHEELAQMLEREVERHDSIDGGYYMAWQLKRAATGAQTFYREQVVRFAPMMDALFLLLLVLAEVCRITCPAYSGLAFFIAGLYMTHTLPEYVASFNPYIKLPRLRRKSKSVVAPLPDPTG